MGLISNYFTLWLGYNWVGGENFLPKYIFKLNEFIRLIRRSGEGWGESVSKATMERLLYMHIQT